MWLRNIEMDWWELISKDERIPLISNPIAGLTIFLISRVISDFV